MSKAMIDRDQLGVQAHCLRREMATDFPGTLQRLRALGLTTIELCSFPGCAGNPWGDFGALAEWPPEQVRDELERAAIECIACHFFPPELTDEAIAASALWARGVGSPAVVLSGLPLTAASPLGEWQSAFERLNLTGLQLRDEGLRFAYHTQNDAWANVGGVRLFDELLRLTDPELCGIELDLSETLAHGCDWTDAIPAASGRLLALHLRDGERPPGPVPWLPALALGEGDLDTAAAVAAAIRADSPHFLLEMEVEPARDVFEALETSIAWLETNGLLGGDRLD